VIVKVVPRATARAVCTAFVAAMAEYGGPEEVLSDTGKQFTGRFGAPRPAEVGDPSPKPDEPATPRRSSIRCCHTITPIINSTVTPASGND
jgi:hypothetical protein